MEFKSSSLLADELEKNEFKVKRGIAEMPTAFTATWGEGKPVIGIMGEYDALQGLSQKRTSWKEPLEPRKPGHGCGHNIYGSSGMTAAIAVKEAMEKFKIKGNRTISELIVKKMREIGLPSYSNEDLKFAEEIAKTITPETKIAQLKKSKRPGWEKLTDKLVDDKIPDPWGEGEVSHGSTDLADVSWQTPLWNLALRLGFWTHLHTHGKRCSKRCRNWT